VFERGWVTLSANFRGMGGHSPTNFDVRKLDLWAITWCCLRDPMFSRFDTIPACDTHTQTDTQGHAIIAITRAELLGSARVKI